MGTATATRLGNSVGNTNGNGVVGNITVEGGGLYNAGGATLISASVSGNSAKSTVTNGSFNGDLNGDNDRGQGDGGQNGNGVVGNITVAGGGILNGGAISATRTSLTHNIAASSVVNGSDNGEGNGVLSFNIDGDANGDGVVGDILVAGGGLANVAINVLGHHQSPPPEVLDQCTVTLNEATSTITNGSDDGDGNGDSNTGQDEGAHNGTGVVGTLDVGGAGIDNETNITINSGTVFGNFAASTLTNGSTNGSANGNNDGNNADGNDNGDGIAGGVTIEGGGIRNLGVLTLSSVALNYNLVQSSVTNGTGNGDGNGSNDSGSHEGLENGNGVSGGILVAGGAIANDGTGTVKATGCSLSHSSIGSWVSNGNNNGQGDGDGALNGATDVGNFSGNGAGAEGGSLVEVEGGGLSNSGSASVTLNSCTVVGNEAYGSVTTGVNGGNGSANSAGTGNGVGDGNGIDGQLAVVGGGTADSTFGKLVLNSTTPTGNFVSSLVSTGSGDVTEDGQVVNLFVTVEGPNTYFQIGRGI